MQQTVQTASAAVTLLQFYPVLAAIGGLLVSAGVIWQKIANILERLKKLEERDKQDTALLVELGRFDERLKNIVLSQEKTEREMAGVQRSLANIASGKVAPITKFEQD